MYPYFLNADILITVYDTETWIGLVTGKVIYIPSEN